MTFWIGLTGGIGSGKSQVADLFRAANIPVIDTDAISRQLTAADGIALPAIRQQFGDAVFDGETLNRAALRHIVFHETRAKQQLENIIFPLIRQQIAAEKHANQHALYGIIDIPLLTENRASYPDLARVLLIDCPEETQIQRVMARSGLSPAEVKRIIANQASRAERYAIADDIIRNQGTLAELANKIQRLMRFYHAHFHKRNRHDSI
ncbi:MAG: dephospho-CoA kinase [Neisseria sp.]|nr:dephospho-CoA kinase [Neisseria sp.]